MLGGGREGVDDLVLMSEPFSEKKIVENLGKRFMGSNIYTYIGPVLLSVNPYTRIPGTTGPEVMALYEGHYQHENAPHIYALAEDTYRTMKNNKESQCVIISGESGAGKTEASKMIMAYVSQVSGQSAGVEYVKSVIMQSNPLLEAFGNAKTIRNDNSSRFGKYFEIMFDKRGDPCGGNITNYLLEKSRVVGQGEGERNFHIFYQLVFGAPPELLSSLQLYEPKYFHYLNQSGCETVSTIDDRKWWQETVDAMNTIGITQAEQTSIFRLLAAILHLGNVCFVENKEGYADVDANSQEELDLTASYLGVDSGVLESALLFRIIVTGFGRRQSTYNSPQNVEQAQAARDALAKELYSRNFDWIVGKVNAALQKGGQTSPVVIGILDIFGFEIFQWNGFEQFCINFVNEKLQQYFIELTLKAEQEEYVREGIEWTPIDYFNNQVVCDLIEGKKPPGIFSILDDSCATAHALGGDELDRKFLGKLSGLASQSKHFVSMNSAFMVKHYAGNVTYEVNGFSDKNKDTLFPDLLQTLQSSNDPFIVAMFPEDTTAQQKKRPTTAGFKIKTSAGELMQALSRCTPHYVRCIKPNDNKRPAEFDAPRVQHQVKYLGLLENVRVRRAGFAFRAPFARFLNRYKRLCSETWGTWGEWTGDPRQGVETILRSKGIQPGDYQMGRTKVFLRKPETLFLMEESLDKHHYECTMRIQKAWRMFKLRKKALEERAQAANLFRGRKQRQAASMQRQFLADYMRYDENYPMQEAIKQAGGAGESMVFASNVKKLNRRMKPELRDFVMTDRAIYIIMRKKKGQAVLYKVTRRLELNALSGVTVSCLQDNFFILHCASDYDSFLEEEHKTEIVIKALQYYKAITGRDLTLNFTNNASYKIRTGDSRNVVWSQGSGAQAAISKKGKTITVSIGPGLDPNTDTTPPSYIKRLQQQSAAAQAPPPKAKKRPPGYRPGYGYGDSHAERQQQPQQQQQPVRAPQPVQRQQPQAHARPQKRAGGPKKGGFVKKGGFKRGGGPKKARAKAARASPKRGGLKKGGYGMKKSPKKGGKRGPPRKAPARKPALPQAQALYDYAGSQQDELAFRAGEVLNVLQQDPSGWWECSVGPRKGWAPATYLKLM